MGEDLRRIEGALRRRMQRVGVYKRVFLAGNLSWNYNGCLTRVFPPNWSVASRGIPLRFVWRVA